MSESAKYLIVGQGLAGSALAWQLHQLGQPFLLVDRAITDSASRVAAGLVNPLLGRKIKPDWRQAECLEAAHRYYRQTEAQLNGSWWQCGEIWRELSDSDQLEYWRKRQQEKESQEFAGPLLPWYGNWEGKGQAAITRGAAVLHAEALVNAQRSWLLSINSLLVGNVKLEDITPHAEGGIIWKGSHYKAIIWCIGYETAEQLKQDWLKSRQSQGCIIDLELPDIDQSNIVLHFGHWLVKRGDNWRLGASYDWVWGDPSQASGMSVSELMHEFGQRYKGDWRIVGVRAAVRPIIRHSQPIAGGIPGMVGHYLFGGLGSRGCTTAPWVSERLARHLVMGEELPEDLVADGMYLRYMRRAGVIKR